MPREALDISSYVDVDALTASLGGTEVFLTMKYPTIDNQNEFDDWTLLTENTRTWTLKTELSKRKHYDDEPDHDPESFAVGPLGVLGRSGLPEPEQPRRISGPEPRSDVGRLQGDLAVQGRAARSKTRRQAKSTTMHNENNTQNGSLWMRSFWRESRSMCQFS